MHFYESLVMTLQEGNFFGEIALLSGKPRQATVKAYGQTVVLAIGRDAFNRLCGSLFEILQRNMDRYSNAELLEEASGDTTRDSIHPHIIFANSFFLLLSFLTTPANCRL